MNDVIFFNSSGSGVISQIVERFDRALLEYYELKHSEFDMNNDLNATCIGVSLEDAVQPATPPARCLAFVIMVLAIIHLGAASASRIPMCSIRFSGMIYCGDPNWQFMPE